MGRWGRRRPDRILRGITRDRQEDHFHELGTIVTWLGGVSVEAEYNFPLNDSNSFGFSYISHNFGLQLLRRLRGGCWPSSTGRSSCATSASRCPTPIRLARHRRDREHVVLLRLVKDHLPDYSIEVRYGWYRGEAITLNDFYTRSIYAIGMNYRP